MDEDHVQFKGLVSIFLNQYVLHCELEVIYDLATTLSFYFRGGYNILFTIQIVMKFSIIESYRFPSLFLIEQKRSSYRLPVKVKPIRISTGTVEKISI